MRLLLFIGIVLGVLCMATAQQLVNKPFIYTQDFEGKDPVPQQPWAVGTKYTVHSLGLTTERAHSGKQAFKVDVTFEDGNYLYYQIPVKIPAVGKLRFSAYVYVPDDNEGSVATGVNIILPPTPVSGCGPLSSTVLQTTKGQWQLIEGDLVADGVQRLDLVTQYMWGVTEDDITDGRCPVGIYVDRIGIFLYGAKGKRVIMYLDDIKIEGEVPEQAAYDAQIAANWARIQARGAKQYAGWDATLTTIRHGLSALKLHAGEAAQMKVAAEAYVKTLQAKVDTAKKKTYLERVDQREIDMALTLARDMPANIKAVAAGKRPFQNIQVCVVPPINSVKILPFDDVMPGASGDTLAISACRGQFQPASFVVRPTVKLKALLATASDLTSGAHHIPAAQVKIQLVKCWYQAGTAWQGIAQNKLHRLLVPELLLNDDRLVKVDHTKQDNYVRGNFPDGDRYLWVSDAAKSVSDTDVNEMLLPVSQYPIKDAPTLQPLELAANTNQQYWLTVHVPEEAAPGKYTGAITLCENGKPLGKLKLQLTVLPFTLSAPYYTSSIYYRGVLRKGWEHGSIGSEFKSEQQLRAELHNMHAHGVDNPTVYQSFDDKELLARYLAIKREEGWNGAALYFLGTEVSSSTITTPDGLATFRQRCKEVAAYGKEHGIKDIYIYGIDEAAGEKLKAEREAFDIARQEGVKLFVAGYKGSAESVGDLLDVLIYAGEPSRSEAQKWHEKTHAIWSYANPQGGVENPEVYRRNFGLLLWKRQYDGACTYAYQHGFGNIWNDFDHVVYRDHNLTYPTVDGVIDTIAWEGYREAVNDVRYLTTLLTAIRQAKDRHTHDADIAKAEAFLRDMDVLNGDLDTLRTQIVQHILKLQ